MVDSHAPSALTIDSLNKFKVFQFSLAYCGVAVIGCSFTEYFSSPYASLVNPSQKFLLIGSAMILAAGIVALLLAAGRYYVQKKERRITFQSHEAEPRPQSFFWRSNSPLIDGFATGATSVGVGMVAASSAQMDVLHVGMLLTAVGATILVLKFVLEDIFDRSKEAAKKTPGQKTSCFKSFSRGMYYLMLTGVAATAVTAGVLLAIDAVLTVNVPAAVTSTLDVALLVVGAFVVYANMARLADIVANSKFLNQDLFPAK